jgi:hypothetical protein
MAREFILSQCVANTTLVAGAAPTEQDLGVNGISFLFISLTALQAANNTPVQINDLLQAMALIEVLYNGQAVWSARADDLARMAMLMTGFPAVKKHAAQAANADTAVSFVLPFGRQPFGSDEGFPSVQRGQLRLRVTPAAAFGDVLTRS